MRQIFNTVTKPDHRRTALLIIIGFFLLKLIVSPFQSLSNDESYGVVLGRSLEMSYFDHPPLHQWIAHYSALIFGESEWARVPFILLFSLASWFIFLAAELAFGAHAALIAVFCLNASWDMLTGAGARILPSNPLMFSFSLGLWALARLTLTKPSPPAAYVLWMTVGFALGLSALSKYHAIFFGFGILLFLILSPHQRYWFKHPAPYLAVLIAICFVAPVMIWNWQNEWASFRFQGKRIQSASTIFGSASGLTDFIQNLNIAASFEVITALIGKLTPWIFLPLVAAIIDAIRKHRSSDPYLIFLCTGLVIVSFFTIAPIFGAAAGHSWSLPGVFFLFPLLGEWLRKKNETWKLNLAKIGAALMGLSALIIAILASNDKTGWIGAKVPFLADAAPRFTLGRGFENLAETQLQSAINETHADFVITRLSYSATAKIAIALGPQILILSQTDPRGLFFTTDQSLMIGKSGLVVAPEKDEAVLISQIAPYVESYGTPQKIEVDHTLATRRRFVVLPVKNLKSPLPFIPPGAKTSN